MNNLSKEDFNDIPVYYCRKCLSLKIRTLEQINIADQDYCEECGSTDVSSTHIGMWEDAYQYKYGYKFLDLNKNGREKEQKRK